MIVHDVKQGSPEWLALRLGKPTASEFDSLITSEWKIRTGQGPQTYLYGKICDAVLGFSLNDADSFAMRQGAILEGEARPWFSFTHDVEVETVGFCTTDDGRVGCSPDGLIGDDGGLEIKCPTPAVHLSYMMEGVLPKDYTAQVHGSMYVTGRKWWNFLSYSRQFPAFLIRVERDETIQAQIGLALRKFYDRFDPLLARITEMKAAENAMRATGTRD